MKEYYVVEEAFAAKVLDVKVIHDTTEFTMELVGYSNKKFHLTVKGEVTEEYINDCISSYVRSKIAA